MTFQVVDLYAGPGGWEEGMKMLGLTSVVGLEWDHAACLTATAAGHRRIRADVSKYCIDVFAGVQGLIASPPCQAWSMAGKRQGEIDRAKVHALVDAYANGTDDPGDGWADERSHHAAQPVRWVRELRPRWVAFEQVPPVLPLWQHAAERFSRWGYSTWSGVLNAADFGVPQTRERAILFARLDGPALPPAPTHTRDASTPLFGDALRPWVTMADALGWGMTSRPTGTVTAGGGKTGGADPFGNATRQGMRRELAEGRWAVRTGDFTAVARDLDGGRSQAGSIPYERPVSEPAPTLTGVARRWVYTRPATTIQGDPRVGRPGHKDRDKGEAQFARDSLRITQEEAAILQSFRPDYPWQGTKTKQFEQIGNAVPPLLAAHIIAAVTGRRVPA